MPEWRKKEIELKRILDLINSKKAKIRNYHREKKTYQFKKTDLNEKPSNFWLRLFFAPFTLGLSFIGYNSQKNASLNRSINQKNKEWNASHEVAIDKENSALLKRITQHNEEINKDISSCWILYHKTKKEEKEYWRKELEGGWEDITHASNFAFSHLKEKKGVYIIWNKTKDKYYVGQAKDIGARLNQHFSNGEVKNVVFAKDWWDKDYFVYKALFCETKDELDLLEKQKIQEYFAFGERGYNKTGGNK